MRYEIKYTTDDGGEHENIIETQNIKDLLNWAVGRTIRVVNSLERWKKEAV